MAREIHDHAVNPANEALRIVVTDEPGSGGANHRYEINGFATEVNPAYDPESTAELVLLFQNGPVKEAGVNGITHEALIAILIDRLHGFQNGPYASSDNYDALMHLHGAQNALQRRTLARIARGVEGTHTV